MGIILYPTKTCPKCKRQKLLVCFPEGSRICVVCRDRPERPRKARKRAAKYRYERSQEQRVTPIKKSARPIGTIASQVSTSNARVRGEYGLQESITVDEWLDVLFRYDYTCVMCGGEPSTLTIDHIMPLAHGGRHTISNLQPLCGRCNTKKGTRHMEWLDDEDF